MVNHAAKNILLVDDYQSFLKALANELKNSNNNHFSILTAENGDRALSLLGSVHVDVIVTDLRMPAMNGFELISHVKRSYPCIPIIVVSSFLYPEQEAELRDLGVSQYMDKFSLTVHALEELIFESCRGVETPPFSCSPLNPSLDKRGD